MAAHCSNYDRNKRGGVNAVQVGRQGAGQEQLGKRKDGVDLARRPPLEPQLRRARGRHQKVVPAVGLRGIE
ncbi:hypothetical protein PybrP1_010311 [[Pythium] brassicae (nom. inval.)]|nr:hypothetical protein PybrP1_010311 [[Pythium] brassicae (nom. inval.)]